MTPVLYGYFHKKLLTFHLLFCKDSSDYQTVGSRMFSADKEYHLRCSPLKKRSAILQQMALGYCILYTPQIASSIFDLLYSITRVIFTIMLKSHRFLLVVLFFLIIIGLSPAWADQQEPSTQAVQVTTAWSANQARPGDSIILAVVLQIREGIHINADIRQIKALEDFTAYPTKLTVVQGHQGVISSPPLYPKAIPFKVQYATGNLMSFKDQAIIYLPINVEDSV
ncbi:MAG: hypothetical protein D3923_01965, partial [Candidatus Electrothrix sp. AR3]|nr:hypothetical protein [Candidatus Electrothrix sp. AR3]